jgi:hypothetical protein
MDILSPGNGQELYQNICTIENNMPTKLRKAQSLNRVVGNLVELCLFAEYWEHKRLAFVQLCGALHERVEYTFAQQDKPREKSNYGRRRRLFGRHSMSDYDQKSEIFDRRYTLQLSNHIVQTRSLIMVP